MEVILKFIIFLKILIQFVASENIQLNQGINLEIVSKKVLKTQSGVHFVDILELQPITHNRFHIKIPDHNETGFTVFQVHCYQFNLTISLNEKMKNLENGTNLGYVLFKNQIVHLFNLNLNAVQCLVASIAYDKFAPIPGGCSPEKTLPINPTMNVKVLHNFLIVTSALARKSKTGQCVDQETDLTYETFYHYLEQDDFSPRSYFNGIKKMLYGDLTEFAYQSKQNEEPMRRFFSKITGRGQIFVTVVSDSKGNKAFYVPSHSYSCNSGLWGRHCVEGDVLKRVYSCFVVVLSIVYIFNILMPIFVESILNGAILGATGSLIFLEYLELGLTHFEIILSSMFFGLITAIIFGIISCYLKFIGNFSSKFIVIYILIVCIVEHFFPDYYSLPLQLLLALVISSLFFWIKISVSVFCGCFLLVFGLSSILRGNLHRSILNNFSAIIAPSYNETQSINNLFEPLIKENYINYHVSLNVVDYILITLFIIALVIATFKKEEYFKKNPEVLELNRNIFSNLNETSNTYNKNNARRRRQKYYGSLQKERLRKLSQTGRHHFFYKSASTGRNPLISHWASGSDTEGSDNVFESPASNARFMRKVSLENPDRIKRIRWDLP